MKTPKYTSDDEMINAVLSNFPLDSDGTLGFIRRTVRSSWTYGAADDSDPTGVIVQIFKTARCPCLSISRRTDGGVLRSHLWLVGTFTTDPSVRVYMVSLIKAMHLGGVKGWSDGR